MRTGMNYLTTVGKKLLLEGTAEGPLKDGAIHLDAIGVRNDGVIEGDQVHVRVVGYWRGKPLVEFGTRQFWLGTGDEARLNDIRLEVDVTLDNPEVGA